MQTSFSFVEPAEPQFSEFGCWGDEYGPALCRVWKKENKGRAFFVVQVTTETGSYDIAREKNGFKHTIRFETMKSAKRHAERHALERGRKERGAWRDSHD